MGESLRDIVQILTAEVYGGLHGEHDSRFVVSYLYLGLIYLMRDEGVLTHIHGDVVLLRGWVDLLPAVVVHQFHIEEARFLNGVRRVVVLEFCVDHHLRNIVDPKVFGPVLVN
jgi:uncharacterized membrane protein